MKSLQDIASFCFCSGDHIHLFFQEQAHDAKQQAVSPEDTEDLSPLPSAVQQPARRRGGISAEPVSEEDATSYVKKV
jgi:cAMP-dependent protein kinase regulator